jgi:hypothetical protein
MRDPGLADPPYQLAAEGAHMKYRVSVKGSSHKVIASRRRAIGTHN